MAEAIRLGTVESLWQGFMLVNRRPWLLALPLLLNAVLWLGPAVTPAPLVTQWLDNYRQLLQDNPALVAAQGNAPAQLLDEAQRIGDIAAKTNVLRILLFQIPSLAVDRADGAAAVEVGSAGLLVLLIVGLLLTGLLGASLYLSGIGEMVRRGTLNLMEFPRRVSLNWLHLLGYYGLLVCIALPILIGAAMLLLVARLLSEELAAFLVSMSAGIALLIQFYLFFAHSAIFAGHAGPLQAIRQSVAVVGSSFWSCMALAVLSWVIGTGFSLIFARLFALHPLGSAAALAGHAYISSGLAAAAMVYFQNRIMLLAAARRDQPEWRGSPTTRP